MALLAPAHEVFSRVYMSVHMVGSHMATTRNDQSQITWRPQPLTKRDPRSPRTVPKICPNVTSPYRDPFRVEWLQSA